ncbi:HNH endonuclease domain-containing protein [uncultured Chryseobacterium sp.]|uniref:HNH endonuclease domain-containing protein n=1 Tax=uncultured Chryseobacterium sp. TaxID=259322 RepID=UPI003749309C
MKKIIKKADSFVLQNNLQYIVGGDNKALSKALLNEQKSFCAYTEEYIGINDSPDVEHFNPNLKGKTEDSYNNWYIVKHKPNQRKTNNWKVPILDPCDEDFEERVIYVDGDYIWKPGDIEAENLITLLNLRDQIFVKERKRYIKRRKERIAELGISPEEYFRDRIDKDIDQVKYLRAIQEEFKIDIWNMIPEITEN